MTSWDRSEPVTETTAPNLDPARVLVLASTFPSSAVDEVPAFVRDQVIAMARAHPELEFHVLAPHDRRSNTRDRTEHAHFTEHRFHYFWPRAGERLAGRGIMPSLRANPLLYAVIPFLFLGEYAAAKRLARTLRPRLLYAHWFTPQAIVASWVERALRIPFVFTTHASDVSVWKKLPLLGPRIVRRAARRAQAITAVSTRSKQKLLQFFDTDEDLPEVRIIPMGTDALNENAVVRERRAAATDAELVILFIGRLVEKKGYEYLVDALELMGAEFGNWRLIVAGDGPLRGEWEQLTRRSEIADHIEFRGYVSGADKAAVFAEADLLVVPSIVTDDGDAEGLPVALLEGLAAGLICVATNESGGDDIITDRENGFLCVQRDATALAAALRAAANLTETEREQMSAAARRLASRFTWTQIAQEHYEFLFEPLLKEQT